MNREISKRQEMQFSPLKSLQRGEMLSAMMMIVLLFTNVSFAQCPEQREQLVQKGLSMLHSENFDSALAVATALRRLCPEDPAGDLIAANTWQTMMRDYRVRIFEAPFDSVIGRAVEAAGRRARRQPSAETLFALGSAKGYRALHRFRRGEWMPALRDAIIAIDAMQRALARDPDFVDPALALALYDYWKGLKLDFGTGIFSRKRRLAIERLEEVRARGRYVAVDATYSLQTIYLQKGDYGQALRLNDWLFARYPNNPICLYHRAILFEKLNRFHEALTCWEKLIDRVHAFQKAGFGFLAECHLHRALLYERLLQTEDDGSTLRNLEGALQLAAAYVQRHDADVEMDGPLESFEAINKAIIRMSKRYP